MSRPSVVILFGILTILTPFSGLPSSFRAFLLVIFGAAVVIAGLMERLERVRAARTKMMPSVSPEEATVLTEVVPEKTPVTEVPHGVSPI